MGQKYKWQTVIEMHDKYPHASQIELAALASCDPKQVRYAMGKPEWKEIEELHKAAANLDTSEVDAVDLLFTKLVELASLPVPDVRVINALMTFLDKTGQLVPKGVEEGCQRRLQKLSMRDLVEVSTGKSHEDGDSDSLYQ